VFKKRRRHNSVPMTDSPRTPDIFPWGKRFMQGLDPQHAQALFPSIAPQIEKAQAEYVKFLSDDSSREPSQYPYSLFAYFQTKSMELGTPPLSAAILATWTGVLGNLGGLALLVAQYAVEPELNVKCAASNGRVHFSYRGIMPTAECFHNLSFKTAKAYERGAQGVLVHIFESGHPDPRFRAESYGHAVDFVVRVDSVYFILQWAAEPEAAVTPDGPLASFLTQELIDRFIT